MSTLILKKSNQAWFAVVVITFAAATAPVFIRFAQTAGVPSLAIIAIRLVLSTLLLTPFAWGQHANALKRLSRTDWLWALAAGAIHAIGLCCLFFALENTTVLVNSVLRRTSPLWTIVLEMVILQASFSGYVWGGLGVTLLGSALVAFGGVMVFDAGQRPLLGAGLSVLDALMSAGYLVIGRKLRDKLPFLAYTWVLFAAASLMALLIVLLTGTPLLGFSEAGYGWIIVITIIAQLMGHLPMNFAVRYFPATYLSVLLQFSVIAAALMAFLYFGEMPTWLQVVGSGLIVVGVSLVTRR